MPVLLFHALQGGSEPLSLWMKSSKRTTDLKATEQYFSAVLFINSLVLKRLYLLKKVGKASQNIVLKFINKFGISLAIIENLKLHFTQV